MVWYLKLMMALMLLLLLLHWMVLAWRRSGTKSGFVALPVWTKSCLEWRAAWSLTEPMSRTTKVQLGVVALCCPAQAPLGFAAQTCRGAERIQSTFSPERFRCSFPLAHPTQCQSTFLLQTRPGPRSEQCRGCSYRAPSRASPP